MHVADYAFNETCTLAAGTAFESYRLKLPAKAACFLIKNHNNQPLKLAITANLRNAVLSHLASTRNRTNNDPQAELILANTITISYRQTFNTIESELAYLNHAPQIAPTDCKSFLKSRDIFWITIDLANAHPTFTITSRAFEVSQMHRVFGPIISRSVANQFIELLQDLFDLCRYPDELSKSPHGKACVYKEMNKCPAPCDGTVAMDAYLPLINTALRMLADGPEQWLEHLNNEMRAAAYEQQFEKASKFKRLIERGAQLSIAPYRLIRPLETSRYVVKLPGSTRMKTRLYYVSPRTIELIKPQSNDLEEFNTLELLKHLEYITAQFNELASRDVTREMGAEATDTTAINPQHFSIFLYHYLNDKNRGDNWRRFMRLPVEKESLYYWLHDKKD